MKRNAEIKKLLRSKDPTNILIAIEVLKTKDYPLNVWKVFMKMAINPKAGAHEIVTEGTNAFKINNKIYSVLTKTGLRIVDKSWFSGWFASRLNIEEINVKL